MGAIVAVEVGNDSQLRKAAQMSASPPIETMSPNA
jgi:hypothetical protein